MFNVVVEHRKRRVWTPRTVAISVGAHLVVLGGIVAAAANAEPPGPPVTPIEIGNYPKAPTPVKPTPPPPPAEPNRPAPVAGRTLVLQPPENVPVNIPPPNPTAPPANPEDFTGLGQPGQVIGDPPANPPANPPADPGPLTDFRDDVMQPEDVDQLPQLASPRDAQRLLERNYPPLLRDAGVAGRTTVVMVIDRNGEVEPGTVEVRETTHDAFRDAAIRAAQRFRFRPAKLHGQAVSVVISIPIEWQIEH